MIFTTLSRPNFFRFSGLACAGLAVLALLGSVPLVFWKGFSLITEFLLLVLLFVICEGVAAMLDMVHGLETKIGDMERKR